MIDFAERNGYIRGVVKEIIHDPGRGAPVAKVQFGNRYKYGKVNTQWTATEGTYTGQFIYCGKKGTQQPPPHARAPNAAQPPMSDDHRSADRAGADAAAAVADKQAPSELRSELEFPE